MKQLNLILTLLAALLWPFAGSSAPVRVERAQVKAAAFFAQSGATRSVPELSLVWDGESAGTRSSADPALYIFNRTDAPGFVIMAGDDGVSPVLAYSFENRFGDVNRMPDNLRWWLEGVRDMIRSAREKGELATPDAGWSAPTLTASEEETERLETALWDQDAPYNNECPYYSGTKRAVTGCIQTAEAIVMKYHRWPETVNKTVSGYTTYTRKIKVDGRTLGSYNWNLMPDTYQRGKYSDAEAAEVARLMADLGVLNQADYDAETGATSYDQYIGLVTVLGFDKSARLVSRVGYSDEEWSEMMRNEIKAGRPVLYSGVGEPGGHAFVLSGYSKEDPLKFYFNWGWSGESNGLYSVAKIGSDHPFPTWQDAIVGLKPDKTSTSQYAEHLELGAGTSGKLAFVGLSADTDKFVKDKSFSLMFGYVWNMGAVAYSGKLALAVYTRGGERKDFLSLESGTSTVKEFAYGPMEPGYGSAYQLTCTIPCALAPGDRLYGLFWNNGTGEWERLRAYDEDTVDSILLMAEPETPAAIATATSLAYDREKKQFTLQTIAELACRIVAADGSVKLDRTTSADPLTIDVSNWAAGSYVLTLTPADGESYTLRLVL